MNACSIVNKNLDKRRVVDRKANKQPDSGKQNKQASEILTVAKVFVVEAGITVTRSFLAQFARAVGGRQNLIRQRYSFDTNEKMTPRRPRERGGELLMTTSALKRPHKALSIAK